MTSKTLLIADDDTTFVNILSFEFEKRQFPCDVISVSDGERTITLLQEHKPDMLVLDLRMPNIDGFGVLEHMRTNHDSVPVIVVTHYHDEEHRKKSEEYGVKKYIVKSDWKIDNLVEELVKHLGE